MTLALRNPPGWQPFSFFTAPTETGGTPCRMDYGEGKSHESRVVELFARNAAKHYSTPYSRLVKDPAVRFYSCHSEWKAAVKYVSDINEICTNFAYLKIIGMGVEALPFIFRELSVRPDHWFWALKAITNADPVPEEHRGRMKLMAQDWLRWGQRHGLA